MTPMMNPHQGDRLLTPIEVGEMFRVDAKTVVRWANAGLISAITTPGGRRRFRESEVKRILAGTPASRPEGGR